MVLQISADSPAVTVDLAVFDEQNGACGGTADSVHEKR
jgi:hypothetical protein